MRAACLVAGFILGWACCLTQGILGSKGFTLRKPITVDTDMYGDFT